LSTPKGMRRVERKLETGDKVHVYSDDTQIVLQIRHEVPTEENLLEPSFKTAVSLNVAEAMTVAGDLLHAASLLLTAQKRVPCRLLCKDQWGTSEERCVGGICW